MLSDFYSRISRIINRGSIYDAVLPKYAETAVRFFEQLREIPDCRRLEAFTTVAGTQDYAIPGLTEQLRNVSYIRFNVDGDYTYVRLTSPGQATVNDDLFNDIPSQAYLLNRTTIRLIKPATSSLTGEICYFVFPEFPTDPSEDYYLVSLFENLVLSQVMLDLSPELRMDGLEFQKWQSMQSSHLSGLVQYIQANWYA